MGRKPIVYSFPMFASVNASTDQDSAIVPVANMDKASIHVTWTGSPVGVLHVMIRNGDNDQFHELDMGAAIAISGANTEHFLVFNELPFTDVQLQYESTSGAGTLSAVITSKATGA